VACEITRIDGALMYVRISGIMEPADQESLQTVAARLIAQGLKVRLLVTLYEFEGWRKGADWGDIAFLLAHGNDVARMAIIGDERWKDQVFAFVGKGLRDTEVEFFPFSSEGEAERWARA